MGEFEYNTQLSNLNIYFHWYRFFVVGLRTFTNKVFFVQFSWLHRQLKGTRLKLKKKKKEKKEKRKMIKVNGLSYYSFSILVLSSKNYFI